MTDTGIRYTHCRGPHCEESFEELHSLSCIDGLCHRCWRKMDAWRDARGLGLMVVQSVEWSVAIDQWLEAGAP